MHAWKEIKDFKNCYTIEKVFNGETYCVEVYVEYLKKSIRFWVGASSGKKRKERDIFESKQNKAKGGLKALLWIKKVMYTFPTYYSTIFKESERKKYLCVDWADNKRRNVYSRLQKEGFRFMVIDNQKILIKQIKNG